MHPAFPVVWKAGCFCVQHCGVRCILCDSRTGTTRAWGMAWRKPRLSGRLKTAEHSASRVCWQGSLHAPSWLAPHSSGSAMYASPAMGRGLPKRMPAASDSRQQNALPSVGRRAGRAYGHDGYSISAKAAKRSVRKSRLPWSQTVSFAVFRWGTYQPTPVVCLQVITATPHWKLSWSSV